MEIKSSAFRESESIPAKYTCDSLNISPPLEWSKGPAGTKTFALICDDPDAPKGTWVHWVMYNIPADLLQLPEKTPRSETLPDGTKQGRTDFGSIGYGGPCPPSGTHRYYFKIYALDYAIDYKLVITKKDLLRLMEGHILDEAQLMGRYKRI